MILIAGLAVLGLLCIYFEFFVPGGILALLGAILLITSTVLFSFLEVSILSIISYVVVVLLFSILACFLALRVIKKSGKRDSFFLKKNQEGFVAAALDPDLLGKEGVVFTELKPSGHVRIEEETYQAISQGVFLVKGTPIEVIRIEGPRLIVKQKK
jgi:membrane-bound serine protease (ClpP class)